MKESDLFEPVKRFLLEKVGCDAVYGEVGNCDVLGTHGVVDIIVELKTTLSFKLLDQAIDRLLLGHYVYIAIPERKSSIPSSVRWLLRTKGIGLLTVSKSRGREKDRLVVTDTIPARFNRVRNSYYSIRDSIKDYHKTEVGGVPSGEGKTDYSVTIDNVKHFLRRNGWSSINEISEYCETHYAQPKPSLSRTLMEEWNKDWCDVKAENGVRYFRYKKEEKGDGANV